MLILDGRRRMNKSQLAAKLTNSQKLGYGFYYLEIERIIDTYPDSVTDPEMAREIFESLKTAHTFVDKSDCLQHNSSIISKMVKRAPQMAPEFFELIKSSMSDKYTESSYCNAYEALGQIVEVQPELAPEIFDLVKASMQSDKHGRNALLMANSTLGKIVKAKPDLADGVVDFIKTSVNYDDCDSVYFSFYAFAKIAEVKPEAAFEYNKEIVSSGRFINGFLDRPMVITFGKILETKPELATDVFEFAKNNIQAHEGLVYGAFGKIAMAKPDLAPEIFELVKSNMQKNKSDYSSGFETLGEIATAKPDLVTDIFEFTKTSMSADGYRYAHGGFATLSSIVKVKPELAPEVFGLVKTIVKSDENNDDFSLALASLCCVDILKADPKLKNEIVELLKSDKFEKLSFSFPNFERYMEALSKTLIAEPELINDIQPIFNKLANNPHNHLYMLETFIKYPDLPEGMSEVYYKVLLEEREFFNLEKEAQKSPNIVSPCLLKTLDKLAKCDHGCISSFGSFALAAPKHATEIFEMVKTSLQSTRDSYTKAKGYESLAKIAKAKQALAPEIFDFVVSDVQNASLNQSDYPSVCRALSEAVIADPKLINKYLDYIEEKTKPSETPKRRSFYDRDDDKHIQLSDAYVSLGNVLNAKPELAAEVLDFIPKTIGNAQGRELKDAHALILEVAIAQPKLAPKALKIMKENIRWGGYHFSNDDGTDRLLQNEVMSLAELSDRTKEGIDFLQLKKDLFTREVGKDTGITGDSQTGKKTVHHSNIADRHIMISKTIASAQKNLKSK